MNAVLLTFVYGFLQLYIITCVESASGSGSGACSEGWRKHGDHCYVLYNLDKNWPDAKDFCQKQGGYLLKLDNNAENSFIKEQIKPGRGTVLGKGWYDLIWIGANDRSREGSWVWTDGSKVVYRGWRYGEPNNQHNEDCAAMYRSTRSWWHGRWNDIGCSNSYLNFICEKDTSDTESSGSGSGDNYDGSEAILF